MTITLTASDPAGTSTTLLDGSGSDVLKLVAADWGNAAWSTTYSGPRGTQGARAAASEPGNRSVSLTFTTQGASGFPESATELRGLSGTVEQVRRHGGTLTVKHSNQGYRQHFRILAGSIQSGAWSNRAERGRLDATIQFTAAPYIEGDPLGGRDTFTADTTSRYTADFGSIGNITTTSGMAGGGAGQFFIADTSTPPFGDQQATVAYMPSTVANAIGGVIVKRIDANNRLQMGVYDNGSNTTLYLEQIVAGVKTTLASTVVTRLTSGHRCHIAGRIEGNNVFAEYWVTGTPPSLGAAASSGLSAVLSGSAATALGAGVEGYAGVWFVSNVAADVVEWFESRPFVYRGANLAGSAKLPGHYRLDGDIPGDAPAKATIDVGVVPESSDTTRFGMLAWARRPPTWNMVTDPGFEWGLAAVARQWTVAGVTGVTGAATSVSQTTGGRYGTKCGEVVTPATANRGVACELTPPGGFRAGVTYTAEVWVRAASATTNTRLRLGVSGDVASETPAALSTAWTLRTVTWTPAANQTQAWLAFEVTAATGTTMQLDGASVYEGTTAPTIPTQRDGNGGLPPFGVLEGHTAWSITGFATSTGAGYLNGRRLIASSGTTATAEWVLDPALIPPTTHSDTLDVEVWAGIENGTTGLEVTTTVQSLSSAALGQTTYTREYGSTPQPVAAVNGLLRLGTIPMVPSGGVPLPQRLVTDWEWTTVGGGLTLNYLLLVIPSQRQASPTGKDTTGYPVFANTSTSRPITRRILPDGRGQASGANSGVWATAPALVGALLEPDAGGVDVVATVARKIPDTAGGAVLALWRYGALAVEVTPRWHLMRDTT